MFERVLVLALMGACGSDPAGPHVLMDFSREQSLYAAPVPADDLRPSSAAQVTLPNPENVGLVDQMTSLLAGNDGFAATGGVFFQISTTIDATNLPTIAQSTGASSPAFVIGIDPNATDFGVRMKVWAPPIAVVYGTGSIPYSRRTALSIRPLHFFCMLPHGFRYSSVRCPGHSMESVPHSCRSLE